MRKAKFPITVKRGHTVVKIHSTPSRGCDLFTVIHYLGTKRPRTYFSHLELAVTEAETVATMLSEGEFDAVEVKGGDRLAHVSAVQAVEVTGVPGEISRASV